MEQIKAILKQNNIAGTVILHTPGHSEFLNHVNTGYSCVTFEGDQLRIKTKGRSLQEVNDSVNMITHFAEVSGRLSLNYFDMLDMLKKHMDIDNEDGSTTSHTQ